MKFTMVAIFAIFAGSAHAQNPKTLESIDTSAFSAVQKRVLAEVMESEHCTCGCDWTIAKCREDDPKCSVSRALLNLIVKDLKAGKNRAAIIADIKEHASTPPPVLDDPVTINIQGDPVIGPE